jgi:hypothetical protein
VGDFLAFRMLMTGWVIQYLYAAGAVAISVAGSLTKWEGSCVNVFGEATEFDLLGIALPESMERFRVKALAFLRQHEDHIAIHRLNKDTQIPTDALRSAFEHTSLFVKPLDRRVVAAIVGVV